MGNSGKNRQHKVYKHRTKIETQAINNSGRGGISPIPLRDLYKLLIGIKIWGKLKICLQKNHTPRTLNITQNQFFHIQWTGTQKFGEGKNVVGHT